MTAHIAHKIPWESLCDVYVKRHDPTWRRTLDAASTQKTLAHVGRVLAQTLQEFKRTSTTTPEEQEFLNPRTWDIDYEISIGGFTGYYDSIIWGYVELNLLLADPLRLEPLLRDYRGQCTFIMSVLLGRHDGGHPRVIADKLAPAFDGLNLKKPLTAGVLQTLRDHAALLFHCMYIMPGENKFLNETWVIARLSSYFRCQSLTG